MNELIRLASETNAPSVAPGAEVPLQITAQNLTTLLDQVSLHVQGIPAEWVEVLPPQLPVFAQNQAEARVLVRPPAAPDRAPAGVYPIRVRGDSQENPGQVGEAVLELTVQLVGEYQLKAGARTGAGEEAVFPLAITNEANSPLHLQFKAEDRANAAWCKFDPFQLTVAAGGQARALLSVRARPGGPVKHTLDIAAEGTYALQGGAAVTAPSRQISLPFVSGVAVPLRLSLQPTFEGNRSERVYRLRVENPGMAAARVQFSGESSDPALQFEFDHAEMEVPAQSIGETRVRVRAPARARNDDSYPIFRVSASVAGTPPMSAQARFMPLQIVEPPPAPRRVEVPLWVAGLAGFLLTLIFLLIAISATWYAH